MIDKEVGDSKPGGPKVKKKATGSKPTAGKGAAKRTGDVGRALRSVYDETLREDVPDDLLDLLGKLG